MKILSTGIDIVEVERIKKICSRFEARFLNKVLTKEEIEKLEDKGKGFYQSLSGRVAAKEAVYKALNAFNSSIKPSWKQIRIYNQGSGSPIVELNGKSEPDTIVVLSLSHTNRYAVAHALLIRE